MLVPFQNSFCCCIIIYIKLPYVSLPTTYPKCYYAPECQPWYASHQQGIPNNRVCQCTLALKVYFAFWQDVNKSWFSFKTCLEWQTKLPKSMPLEVTTKLTSDGLPIPYHMLDLVLLALLITYWHFILAKFSNGNSKQTDYSKHRFRNILTF